MAKDDECLEAIKAASGGKIDDPEKLLFDVKREAALGRGDYNEAAQAVIGRYREATEELRYRRFQDLEKSAGIRNSTTANVRQLMADNPKMEFHDALNTALSARNIPTHKPITGGYDTYEGNLKLMHKTWVDSPAMELQKTPGLYNYVYDPANRLNIRREVAALSLNDPEKKPGYTGDKMAAQAAQTIKSSQDAALSAFRKEGVFIKDMPGYTTRMSYDPEKIQADLNIPGQFEAFIKQHWDEKKTLAGRELDNPDYFLKDIGLNLGSGLHIKAGHEEGFTEPGYKPTPGKAGQLLHRKVLYWKDADAEEAVASRYGYHDSFGDEWRNGMSRMAKNYAAIRMWGSNPEFAHEANIDYQLHTLQQEFPAGVYAFRQAGMKDKLMDMFHFLDGTAEQPNYRAWAAVTSGVKSVASFTMGGFIPVIHYWSAVANRISAAPYVGKSFASAAVDSLKDSLAIISPAGARQKAAELAASYSEGVQGHLFSNHMFTDKASRAGSFDQEIAKHWKAGEYNGVLSTLVAAQQNALGTQRVYGLNRIGWEVAAAKLLADHVKTDYSALNPEERATLDGFNIKQEDWSLMQKIPMVENSNKINHLLPNMAYKLQDGDVEAMLRQRGDLTEKSNSKIVDLQVERYKDDLARKLNLYAMQTSQDAISAPGEKLARLAGGQTVAHNMIEAGVRSMLQLAMTFKQWPAQILLNNYARAYYRAPGGASATLRIAGSASMLTVAGYMTLATNALLHGEEPPDPTDAMTWVKSAMRSGAATLLADYTGQEFMRNNPAHSIGAMVAVAFGRAVGGVGESLAEPWVQLMADGIRGKNVDKDLQRLIQGTGGALTNNIYTALATNYLFWWHIYDILHPGWAAKNEASKEKYGGKYLSDTVRPTQAVGQ